MYKSLIFFEVIEEIDSISKWYEERKVGLGKQFIKKVRNRIRFLEKSPKLYKVRYKDIRTTTIDIFPYAIHYSIDEENKVIHIFAILHNSRDPKIWDSD